MILIWTYFDRAVVFQPPPFLFFFILPDMGTIIVIDDRPALGLPEIICVISITTTSYESYFGQFHFGPSHIVKLDDPVSLALSLIAIPSVFAAV